MYARPFQALTGSVRQHGAAVLTGADDPHAELLAMVWGPRFDRLHAQRLVTNQQGGNALMHQTVMEAADGFDALGSAQQQRVRRLILRHHARVKMPHASPITD